MAEPARTMPSHPTISKFYRSAPLRWGLGITASLIVILFSASFFIDEPLRRVTERKLNAHLKGYTVRLPELHLRLIGFTVTLKRLTVQQQAHPDPPVIKCPTLKSTIHWRELLSGRLVGEVKMDRPKVNVNLLQLRSEVSSEVPLSEKGWQQAIEAAYPLKINKITISDGEITYTDVDPQNSLKLSNFNFQASNIRNIHFPDKVYPSSFHLNTKIFGNGTGTLEGRANFLAVPVPGIKADFSLDKIPIDNLKTVFARANLQIQGGHLKASGNVEYAPKVKTAHIDNLRIQGMKLDYIHSPQTAAAERRRSAAAGRVAKKLSNNPGLILRINQLNLADCTFGMVNKGKTPHYRIFLSEADISLTNFSNQFSQGPAVARLTGKFMGNGPSTATATFRPEKNGPDLDLYLKIQSTELRTLNDLLRAYAKFDVTAGYFSLVTELHVKGNAVSGYLKPFFKDIAVRRDKTKGPLHRIYEILVGGVAKLLENRPREEVATKADISGPVKNPEVSTWQVIALLVRNAFFKAILPTFEKEASTASK